MATPIPRLNKGGTPTLLDADLGNKLIDALNALSNLTVSPNYGRMTTDGKGGAVLDLGPLQQTIADLLKKLNAIQSSGGGATDLAPLTARLDAVIASINASSLSIVCNGDGTITGTLTFPNMPAQSSE